MQITRPGFLVGVLLPIIFFGAVAQRASQTPSHIPSTAAPHDSQPEAQVLITIASKGGSPFSAPAKSDFLIRDDRHSVEANEVRSVKDEPLIFSLLVDASASMQSIKIPQIAGAIRLFQALSRQGNRGYLILFRDEVATNDEFLDAPSAEQILNQQDSRQGSTALYDAIVHAAKQQLTLAKKYSSSRRAIFLFSDGGDNASRNSLERTLTVLQREGIPVFPIGMPSKKPSKQELANLRALSQNTGGVMVSLEDPGDFVSRLFESIDNQYQLSFSAFPAKRHKLHSLEVKSVSQDIEVSAPTQYLAP